MKTRGGGELTKYAASTAPNGAHSMRLPTKHDRKPRDDSPRKPHGTRKHKVKPNDDDKKMKPKPQNLKPGGWAGRKIL